MLRLHLPRRSAIHTASRFHFRHLPRPRSFHDSANAGNPYGYAPPRLRKLGPIVFCIDFVVTVYLAAAAWDVYRDVQVAKQSNHRLRGYSGVSKELTYADLHKAHEHRLTQEQLDEARLSSASPLDLVSRLTTGTAGPLTVAIAVNLGAYAGIKLSPQMADALVHTPAGNRNWSLATSPFYHTRGLEIAWNVLAIYGVGSFTLHSKVFNSDNAPFAAFYLSASTLSMLGAHLVSNVASPRWQITSPRWQGPVPKMFYPLYGPGGIIAAMFAAFAVQNPEQPMSLLHLASFKAGDVLATWVALETWNALWGLKNGHIAGVIPFHPQRLVGLAIGSAYVYFDGKERVWERCRRVMFRVMSTVGAI